MENEENVSVVYAAMRGTTILRLFATRASAQQWVDEYNAEFTRGTLVRVYPMNVNP